MIFDDLQADIVDTDEDILQYVKELSTKDTDVTLSGDGKSDPELGTKYIDMTLSDDEKSDPDPL